LSSITCNDILKAHQDLLRACHWCKNTEDCRWAICDHR